MSLARTLVASDLSAAGTTITAMPLGTASADRMIVVMAETSISAVTGVTINGVTGTFTDYPISSFGVSIVWATAFVPSGTSGNVVLAGGGAGWTMIGAWAVTGGAQATPSDHVIDISFASPTTSITVPAGGIILGLATDDSGTLPVVSWTVGLTNDGSNFSSGGGTSQNQLGSVTSATAQTVTCTFSGATVPATFSASFGPTPTTKPANQNRLLLGVG